MRYKNPLESSCELQNPLEKKSGLQNPLVPNFSKIKICKLRILFASSFCYDIFNFLNFDN